MWQGDGWRGWWVRGASESMSEDSRNQEIVNHAADWQGELASLRLEVDDQRQCIRRLTAQVEALRAREKDLREMLLEAHDELSRRREETAVLRPAQPGTQP